MKATVSLCLAAAVTCIVGFGQNNNSPRGTSSAQTSFSVVETDIPTMRSALERGTITSHELVTQYLIRIAIYEHKLNAVMTVNPNALQEADERDRERAQGRVRGPLHGIPIALKDNIQTTNMPTTGGALAFEGFVPPYEATLTKNLRSAGAIIIAKTNLDELASWVAGWPYPIGGGYYNAIRGHGLNPYDPRRDPRDATNDGRSVLETGGSSSGAGTAANLWAANVGTDTTGSVTSPADENMLVGIRPTTGRISRYGVIPITADQDTPGPMTKTVADAAIMLGALEGAEPDPNDPATRNCMPPPGNDYTRYLNVNGLKGARIGIPRAFYYDKITPAGTKDLRGGLTESQAKVIAEAIEILRKQGSIIVDPVEIPSVVSKDPNSNYVLFDFCYGGSKTKGKDADCSIVLKYGMKRDFNKWLLTLGPSAPVKTLTELRIWNITHVQAGAIRYGQPQLDISDELDLDSDRARYEADRAKDLLLTRTNGIDAVMKANHLDALLFPGISGADIGSRAGYPEITVPFGTVPNDPTAAGADFMGYQHEAATPFPPGFNAKPEPYGISFAAGACQEPRIIELGYAFEQATKRRVPPASAP
jgi:amidase